MNKLRSAELSSRLLWLINIRWIATVGVVLTILFCQLTLKLALPFSILYFLSATLIIANILYLFFYRQHYSSSNQKIDIDLTLRFANTQIYLDVILLSLFLYLSGGIFNPFKLFFIFHMINACLILPIRSSFYLGVFALTFFGGLTLLSTAHIIPYYPLLGFSPLLTTPYYLFSVYARLSIFSLTVLLLIFFTSSIVYRLRRQEALLEKQNQQLHDANEEKSQFILQVTHELRAPIAAIQNYLNVAIDGYMGPMSDKINKMILAINTRASTMLTMINELLDLATLKSKKEAKLTKSGISIASLFDNQVHLFKGDLHKQSIQLKLDSEPNLSLFVDRESFEILLTNLIGNAIKYSPQQSTISIKAKQTKVETTLCITDQGIGISKEDLPHIFEEFYRSQSAVTKEQIGTGLGLSLVKRIINSHSGKIEVKSILTEGTTVTVTVPNS
jgi:two-component system, OmpR family, phosphate regulon sensor histidine kinase PhoR